MSQNQDQQQGEAILLPVLTVSEAMERLSTSLVVMQRVGAAFEQAKQIAEFSHHELMMARQILDNAILAEAAAKAVQQ